MYLVTLCCATSLAQLFNKLASEFKRFDKQTWHLYNKTNRFRGPFVDQKRMLCSSFKCYQISQCQRYDFGHTLLCHISQTQVGSADGHSQLSSPRKKIHTCAHSLFKILISIYFFVQFKWKEIQMDVKQRPRTVFTTQNFLRNLQTASKPNANIVDSTLVPKVWLQTIQLILSRVVFTTRYFLRNLQMGPKCQSVCHWLVFQPTRIFVGKAKSLLQCRAPLWCFTKTGSNLTRKHCTRLEEPAMLQLLRPISKIQRK